MAISVLQRNAVGNAAATTTVVLPFGSNLTAGSAVIVVGVTGANPSALSGVTDTQGLSYGSPVSIITGTSFTFKVWIAYGASAAANTVTVTTGFNSSDCFVFEAAGLASSGAFDKSATQDQAAVTALDSTNTATLTNANNLLIGITANTASPGLAPTLGAGYANLQALTTAFAGAGSEEKIVASNAAANATFTIAANSQNETTAIYAFTDTAPAAPSSFNFVKASTVMVMR